MIHRTNGIDLAIGRASARRRGAGPTPARPSVAYGPAMDGWDSRDWVGAGPRDALSGSYPTSTFAGSIEAEVVVVVKHAHPPAWAAGRAARDGLIDCPVDLFGRAADVDEFSSALRKILSCFPDRDADDPGRRPGPRRQASRGARESGDAWPYDGSDWIIDGHRLTNPAGRHPGPGDADPPRRESTR